MSNFNITGKSAGNINIKVNKSSFISTPPTIVGGGKGEKGDKGDNGLSAYEIYMKHNPDPPMTEEEWANRFKSIGLSGEPDDYLTEYNNAKNL